MEKRVMTTDMVSLTSFFSETEMEGIDVLSDGDDLFFPAIECAKRLGYHNPRDAIRRHCKRETKTVDEIVVTGKRKDGSDAVQVIHRKYICEADFYRLLFHSRTPIGERFADWLMDEVLPSIRANGFYYGRRFTDLLHRNLQAEKEVKDGMITQEEAEAISKAFYVEVDILAEKIKKLRGKETPTS